MPSFALPPARRLRRRGEFQRVFDTGRRAHGRFFTVIAARSDGPGVRLGIVASRKLGGAVARNRAKRLIRNVFRTSVGPEIPSVDLVILPKPAIFDADPGGLSQDFKAVLRRCGVSIS
jgi:ribonuclease P protein component